MRRALILAGRAAVLMYALTALADDVELSKDLTSVIVLMGLPCGQVVSVQRLAENDHMTTCKTGDRYRVFVSPEGRVVAQKQ